MSLIPALIFLAMLNDYRDTNFNRVIGYIEIFATSSASLINLYADIPPYKRYEANVSRFVLFLNIIGSTISNYLQYAGYFDWILFFSRCLTTTTSATYLLMVLCHSIEREKFRFGSFTWRL
jgi:hypothetical protein